MDGGTGGTLRILWSVSLALLERFGPTLEDEELEGLPPLPRRLELTDADLGFLARHQMVWL